jgi:TorA maturation chaperone TorD
MAIGETRDEGLVLAIHAAGSISALARGLGISQPSVSSWTRVPAERVAAVESFTGISRDRLRPDIFGIATMMQSEAAQGVTAEIDETDQARADEYRLLATLLARPPTAEVLAAVATIAGNPSPLGMAHIGLGQAAAEANVTDIGREYFNVFVGVGRGEVLPYASYYLTGFLHERPLARVREDLVRLGIERREGVHEPEDQLATMLEVMAGLIGGDFRAPVAEQKHFFERHLKPWAARCFADIQVAESAKFYRAVAAVGRLWIEIESEAFELPE